MKINIAIFLTVLGFTSSNSLADQIPLSSFLENLRKQEAQEKSLSTKAVMTCKVINSVSLIGEFSHVNDDFIGENFIVNLNKDSLVISTVADAAIDFKLEKSFDRGAWGGGVGFSASGYGTLGYEVKVKLENSHLIRTSTKAWSGNVIVQISKCEQIDNGLQRR